MKPIILKTALCLLLAGFAVSCVELDTPPYDGETDLTYWEKPGTSLNVLNSCYSNLYSAEEVFYADAMTDNAYTKATTNLPQAIGNGSYSPDDPYVKSVWDFRYSGIRLCNQLTENIDKEPGLSTELYNRYLGEVKVIRAFLYFELYSRFGDIPYYTHVISIAESQEIRRTPKSEIVENLLVELNEVINNNYLPSSYSGSDVGRITRWAAMAVKACILLFESRWSELKEVTGRIIAESPHRLFPDYAGLFELANENNEEVILDLQQIYPDVANSKQYEFLPPSLGGYAQLAPLQELVDNYITLNGKPITETGSGYDRNDPFVNRDPRLQATIAYTGNSYPLADGSRHVINCEPGSGEDGYGLSNSSPTGYYIKKYWDKDYRGNLQSGLNIILIRYADVLLMHAEALAELGEMNEAAWNNTIYLLRERAGFTDPEALKFPGSGGIVEVIRRERRSELALEGLRLKDIQRLKIGSTVLNGWCHGLYTGEVVGTDNGYVRVEQRTFTENKHSLWLIPQNDRNLNSNLTQNPNW